jgi:hypothetical protein
MQRLSRRRVFGGASAAAAVALASRFGSAATLSEADPACPSVSPTILTPNPQRSVSLRKTVSYFCCGAAQEFDGLTRLDGYTLDPDNDDIILWGLSEPGQPSIRFRDFMVAYRAAFGKYTANFYKTARENWGLPPNSPSVSIRPTMEQFNSCFSEMWSPFTVYVYNMPRDTRVANVLVAADYRMKLISVNKASLPIAQPFPTMRDLRIQRALHHRRDASLLQITMWYLWIVRRSC